MQTKNKNNMKKVNQKKEEMLEWSSDSALTYIRALHEHIKNLYDENDNLQEIIEECNEEIDGKEMRIERLTKANEDLAKQVLELKAQIHDLLK